MLTDDELVNKHIIPCLNEMYTSSETLFDFPVTFEMVGKFAPIVDGERQSVYGCFYLSKEKYNKLIKKHTKNFQSMWYFPFGIEEYKKGEDFKQLEKDYNANPDDENLKEEYELTIERMKHDRLWNEYQSKVALLWTDYENGRLTLKTCRKKEAELAKEYGCVRRSMEKEKVEFNVRGFAPNQNADYFQMVKNYYLAGASDNLVTDETPRINKEALKDAKLAKAFEKNCKTKTETI